MGGIRWDVLEPIDPKSGGDGLIEAGKMRGGLAIERR